MTDRQRAAPDRLHSTPLYREPHPRCDVLQHMVVMQSASASTPFVERLEQPVVLSGERADFADRLHILLNAATVGSHLYIIGDEAFIWRIHALARSAGLRNDEIDMRVSAPGMRLAYCVHCGLTQPCGPAAALQCTGCDVRLGLREHFSQRLGAYLGVCENPDQPYAGRRS